MRARSSIIASLAIALTCGTQVIAAARASDQPPSTQARDAGGSGGDSSDVGRALTHGDLVTLGFAAVALALVLLTGWHRLARAPRRPEAITPASAFFLLCGMYLLGPVGMSLAVPLLKIEIPAGGVSALPFDDAARLMLAATAARSLGVIAFVLLVRQSRRPIPDHRASPAGSIAVGAAGLLLAWPLVLASVLVVGWVVGAPEDPIAHDTLRQMAGQPLTGWSVVMIALVTIAGPVIEETMYRGLLQETLRRVGLQAWPAIALASVVFALAHVSIVAPHALIGLFVLSLAFGWSYERTGRLWAPITLHALYNAGNLIAARSMV